MKRLKRLSVFVVILSSLFFIQGIYAYLTSQTVTITNAFTVKEKVNYTVIHQLMDLDGQGYTTVSEITDEIAIGETITPDVNEYEGFISPNAQTVTINSFDNVTITYQYEREKYNLTINNSEYVTTTTPTGEYYYGKTITLEADPEDANGSPFVKWSNNETSLVYEFVIKADTEIEPIYASTYTITYEPNNGAASFTDTVLEGHSIGTFPTVVNESCTGTTGSYSERNCEYAYEFMGWYAEPTFEHEIGESLVPTEDITLYAKWNKVYYHNDGPYVFDGTNFIDTQISLFNETNADRDFIVTLTLDAAANKNENRAVLFGDMDETGEPFPGLLFRWFGNKYNINANAGVGKKKNDPVTFGIGDTIIIKRENGILSYSTDNGVTFTAYNDYTNFNLYFDTTATFGGEYDGTHTPYRFFKGTLSDMTVEIVEEKRYTVRFNANGGTGMMPDQKIAVDKATALNGNTFKRPGHPFIEWNTEPDGTGTSYSNREAVTGLAGEDEMITLYAQWKETLQYTVRFDANGGTGTMADQDFTYDEPQSLNPSEFTKENYIFDSWNTKPDGTGTRYEEGEEVENLTDIDGDVVTLYAHYGKRDYRYDGEIEFNGIDDIIDTEVNLYSKVNIDKDFIISFDVISIDPSNATTHQATIMNAKDETHSGELVPGFVARFEGDVTKISVKYKWGNVSSNKTISTNTLPIHIEYTRTNGVVKLSYSYDGGETSTTATLYNQNDWELDANCPSTVTFGAIDVNGVQSRFFKGTLANLVVHVED